MVSVLMMLWVANCFAVRAVARHMVGLVAGVGLSGITGQLTRLPVVIASAIITGLIMGCVATLGLIPTIRHGFTAVGCLGALTTFFKCCFGRGNATAKAGPAGGGWFVLLSVGLSLLASQAAFWLLRHGRL